MENTNTGKENYVLAIGKGVIFSFITTLILLFIFSIVLTYTNISENTIAPIIIIITGISILIGSSLATVKIKKKGLFNGALIGGIYVVILYFLSSILNTGFGLGTSTIIMIIVGVITGMLGGIVGVNLKWLQNTMFYVTIQKVLIK